MARTRGRGRRKRKAVESHEPTVDRGTTLQESTSGVANGAVSEPCESSSSQRKKLKTDSSAQKENLCPSTSSQSIDQDGTSDSDSDSVDSWLRQHRQLNKREDDIAKRDMELINNASLEDLRKIVKRLYKIQPGLILGMFESLDSAPPSQPSGKRPDFCVCGRCVESKGRYADRENVCCGRKRCLSIDPMMDDEVLDLANLEIAMENRRSYRHQMSMEELQRAYRHLAYKEFEDWHFGGTDGRHEVIPSCVVARIRDKFPSPFDSYRGYDPEYH